MAYRRQSSSSSDPTQCAREEIPKEDKQLLSALGFDAAAYIGHGAYGYVFNGICNSDAKKFITVEGVVREILLNGRSCAIKMFKGRGQWADDFRKEANSLLELNHPNIVELFSVCKHGDNFYIIMELINGGSLKRFLETMPSKMDEFTALQMIRQLTAGLQYLHNQKKVHGDLHNQNIMISTDDDIIVCKIVDFGNSGPLEAAQERQMRDITNLGYILTQILDKSVFKKTQIEGNVRAVVSMMNNRVFNDMNQVVEHLSRYLPPPDVQPPQNSFFNRFPKLFKK